MPPIRWTAIWLGFMLAFATASAQDTFDNVERIVAIGDVHADHARLVEVLGAAKIIDANQKWAGGAAHLVLVGDFVDRGPDSRKVMDLLMALEPQAIAAGGQVHALIGNHEAMNLHGDLRYVSNGDYESFRTPKSKATEDHPAGWAEHRDAFGPKGVYGEWLRRRNAVIRINDAIFLHGGISPRHAQDSLEKINKGVRREIQGSSRPSGGFTVDSDGPLWYRGLVAEKESDAKLAAHVDRVLATHNVRRIVVGHTIVPVILPRFGGKVLAIDTALTGILGGPGDVLIVESGKYYSLHRGHKLELPEPGADPLPYLRSAAALDPPGTALRKAFEAPR